MLEVYPEAGLGGEEGARGGLRKDGVDEPEDFQRLSCILNNELENKRKKITKKKKQEVGWGQLSRQKEQLAQSHAGVQWHVGDGYLSLALEISR